MLDISELGLRNLRAYFFYVFLILTLCWSVRSECKNGYEITCIWIHDDNSALKWVPRSESNERFLELSGCKHPNCGTAVLQGPWLPPRNQESLMTLRYKLYGTSAVYLRLYMKTEDNKQHQLFSQAGNYAFQFPTTWSSKKFPIPVTSSRHRLLLKAYTPYEEAFVAVRNINLGGSIPITITVQPTTKIEEEEENLPDSPEFYNEEENEVGLEPEESQNEDRYQALEVNFIGDDELKKGYTRVMDPNICKYKQ